MTLITVTARRELTGYMGNTATYRDLEGSESAQSTLISDKDIALTTAVVTPGGHPTAPCTWCWLFCCLLFAYCIRVHHGYTPNKQRERGDLEYIDEPGNGQKWLSGIWMIFILTLAKISKGSTNKAILASCFDFQG